MMNQWQFSIIHSSLIPYSLLYLKQWICSVLKWSILCRLFSWRKSDAFIFWSSGVAVVDADSRSGAWIPEAPSLVCCSFVCVVRRWGGGAYFLVLKLQNLNSVPLRILIQSVGLFFSHLKYFWLLEESGCTMLYIYILCSSVYLFKEHSA